MNDPHDLKNTLIINLKMNNGSVAPVSYFSNGSKKVDKEYIEVFSGGLVAQMFDFKRLVITGEKLEKKRFKTQAKRHATELKAFVSSITEGRPVPIPFEEQYISTLATLKVIESITRNQKIDL